MSFYREKSCFIPYKSRKSICFGLKKFCRDYYKKLINRKLGNPHRSRELHAIDRSVAHSSLVFKRRPHDREIVDLKSGENHWIRVILQKNPTFSWDHSSDGVNEQTAEAAVSWGTRHLGFLNLLRSIFAATTTSGHCSRDTITCLMYSSTVLGALLRSISDRSKSPISMIGCCSMNCAELWNFYQINLLKNFEKPLSSQVVRSAWVSFNKRKELEKREWGKFLGSCLTVAPPTLNSPQTRIRWRPPLMTSSTIVVMLEMR